MARLITALLVLLVAPGASSAQDLFHDFRFLPLAAPDQPQTRAALLCDRQVFWNDDGRAQVLAMFYGSDVAAAGTRLKLELNDGSNAVGSHEIELGKAEQTSKIAFYVNTDALKPGSYTLGAALIGADGAVIAQAQPCTFVRQDKSHPAVAIPKDGIPLIVQPLNGAHDTVWPITTGVPMPHGTVRDPSTLELLENGKPVSAQWTTRATWSPGQPSSVMWAGLDFQARYDQGKPREYRIRMPDKAAGSAGGIQVDQTDETITIITGPLRLQIDRKRFTGIAAAWLDRNGDQKFADDEKTIQAPALPAPDDKSGLVPAPAGPYLIDARGILYEAAHDPSPQVFVEEQGPLRVTVTARGWYTNPKVSDEAGKQLCQFITRITAHAGQPTIHLSQRTVITFDTRLNKLADVAFAVPVVSADQWMSSIDGQLFDGAMPEAGKSVYIHQERHDRVRLIDASPAKPKAEGKRSDGWMSVGPVAGFLRDVWQKFPKEIEVDTNGLTFHFWPKHGRRAFTADEELDRANIHKLWFAHQGRLLDLQMPGAYYDKLSELDAQNKWDYEDTALRGYLTTGQGVAIGNDFAVRLHVDAGAQQLLDEARIFQLNPHALTDPKWNVATQVEGKLAARDEARWPNVERMLNEAYPAAMHGMVDQAGEYGMWIYANTHNNWELPANVPHLHRIWHNSHYRQVWVPWMFYFRSANWELLRWARACGDNWMDVGTVNYASIQPGGRPAFKARVAGAMFHVKGFVPWGSRQYGASSYDVDVATWGHWINPDAFRSRYLIDGNLRARDMYQQWGDAYADWPLNIGPGREGINTMGELLSYYHTTWDPRSIPHFRDGAEKLLATAFKDYPHGWSNWHKQWHQRYYDLTRDERIVKSVADYIAFGHDELAQNAFAFHTTGDKTALQRLISDVYDTARIAYYNPDDPLHGYGLYTSSVAVMGLQQLPAYLAALDAAQIPQITPGAAPRGLYPVSGSHTYKETGLNEIAMTILALDPDDRPFKIRLETLDGYDMHPADIVVISPAGEVIQVVELHPYRTKKYRYVGKDAMVLDFPSDGHRGVYKIHLLGHSPLFFAPLTDLPHEIALWPKDRGTNVIGRQQGFVALPPNSTATLSFGAVSIYGRGSPAYVRVIDSSGGTVLENSMLIGSKRPDVSVELTSGEKLQAWSIFTVAEYGPSSRWNGSADALYYAARLEDIQPILDAMPASPTKNP